jgi:hypothetical protein
VPLAIIHLLRKRIMETRLDLILINTLKTAAYAVIIFAAVIAPLHSQASHFLQSIFGF